MTDSRKVEFFQAIQKSLEMEGYEIQCEDGFIVRHGEFVETFASLEELYAFQQGLKASCRVDLRGTLFEIINVRNNPHEHGAVGKITAIWKLAEEAVQRTGPQ